MTLQQMLESQVPYLWNSGWQPADVEREVRRELGADELRVVRCVLAAEASSYEALGARVAPDWMSQLESIEATRWWDPGPPYLLQLGRDWPDILLASVRLLDLQATLPRIPILMPPPSQWRDGMVTGRGSNLPTGLLDKVRSLLAKAESTTFDAEAEAFTAKAQELMARHRIDRAVLSRDRACSHDEPVGRRVTSTTPTPRPRPFCSTHQRCQRRHSVWTKDMGFATVFAFADELDAIEELFTSLLVQATAALQREGPKHDHLGRSRTTRFRRSFLVSFARAHRRAAPRGRRRDGRRRPGRDRRCAPAHPRRPRWSGARGGRGSLPRPEDVPSERDRRRGMVRRTAVRRPGRRRHRPRARRPRRLPNPG